LPIVEIPIKSTELVDDAIDFLLCEYPSLSSNQLRKEIRKFLYKNKQLMRKTRRDTDQNSGYVPSESTISSSVEHLLKMGWIQREESAQPRSKEFRGLNKVFYSLTEEAKFAQEIGLSPDELYILKDAYQMIIRTATTGIIFRQWDESLKIDKATRRSGTSVSDIVSKKDQWLLGNFNHRNFIEQDIEPMIEDAYQKKILLLDSITDGKKRYRINPRLKEFVYDCWNRLHLLTRALVVKLFILKKVRRKDPNYENYRKLHTWLATLYDEKYVSTVILDKSSNERGKYRTRESKEILAHKIRKELDSLEKLREELIKMYEKNNNSDTLPPFNKVKESVLYYTCPVYVTKIIRNIVENV